MRLIAHVKAKRRFEDAVGFRVDRFGIDLRSEAGEDAHRRVTDLILREDAGKEAIFFALMARSLSKADTLSRAVLLREMNLQRRRETIPDWVFDTFMLEFSRLDLSKTDDSVHSFRESIGRH